MKNINDYIVESIFDIDDETITNKVGAKLNIEFKHNTERDFNKLQSIDLEQLQSILVDIVVAVDDGNDFIFSIFTVERTTLFEFICLTIHTKEKRNIAQMQIWYEKETRKISLYQYDVTETQNKQFDKVIKEINEKIK